MQSQETYEMKKKTYIIVAPEDGAYDEVYEEVGDGCCGEFVCRCYKFEWAKKICGALEKQDAE